MPAQIELDIAGRNGNSEVWAHLQIVGEKIPAGLADNGATVSDRGGLMIVIGPAESLKGKEKCYCRHHRGWNPPLKIALAILRD
jgi:hypothetical protein